jgi:methylated-DNA-[protein]-cysteine S-methyltransferase
MKPAQIVRNELVMETPVGKLRLVASNKGLTAIDVKATYSKLATKPDGRAQEILAETRKQLTQYFAGDRKKFDLPFDLTGTPFQVKAWKTLTRIPYGKTISYGEQAKAMRKAKAFRAVGFCKWKESNSHHHSVSSRDCEQRWTWRLFVRSKDETAAHEAGRN